MQFGGLHHKRLSVEHERAVAGHKALLPGCVCHSFLVASTQQGRTQEKNEKQEYETFSHIVNIYLLLSIFKAHRLGFVLRKGLLYVSLQI